MSNLVLLTIPITGLISWMLAIQSEKDVYINWMLKLRSQLINEGYEVISFHGGNIGDPKAIDIYDGKVSLSVTKEGHEFLITKDTSQGSKNVTLELIAYLSIDKKQKDDMIRFKVIDALLNINPQMGAPTISREIFSNLQPKMKPALLTATYLQFLRDTESGDQQRIVLYPEAKFNKIIKLIDEMIDLAETINHLNFNSNKELDQNNLTGSTDYNLKCIICYGSIFQNMDGKYERVLQLLCCNYFAHPLHLRDWLNSRNECPSCKRISPRWMRVNLD